MEDFSAVLFTHDTREWGALTEIAHLLAVFSQALFELHDRQAQEFLPLPRPTVIDWTISCKPTPNPLAGSTYLFAIQLFGYEAV